MKWKLLKYAFRSYSCCAGIKKNNKEAISKKVLYWSRLNEH